MEQSVYIYPFHCSCGYYYEGYETKNNEGTRFDIWPVRVVKKFKPREGFHVPKISEESGKLIFSCPNCQKKSKVKSIN